VPDACSDCGEFYIAMEMVEGKDLREVWNRCVRVRQRIPIEVALHVAREVARVLAYVHGYGELKLVHRDIAPPNILLGYNGDVKLTDFGLARSELKEEKTQPGVVFGRAAYLAPEQARGEVADPRTDVYTLAIVLWELLTGHQYLPISGLDPGAGMALVRHPKPMPPSSRAPWIAPELDKVVLLYGVYPRTLAWASPVVRRVRDPRSWGRRHRQGRHPLGSAAWFVPGGHRIWRAIRGRRIQCGWALRQSRRWRTRCHRVLRREA